MTGYPAKPSLSAVFVDYDNIYLSLKRKNEEAAKRFAKDAAAWGREIASGRLITPTNTAFEGVDRRIVMNRCYGNPVPRRNTQDNSTDMNSFPFVRHHFLRSGFEVIDCPPLTAQLKNSSDIRMVMDVRDFLTHDTYFDEFVILSGDADFTPVLHRLRAHARRTVIFANDYTAAPYTSICDGEIREADLITLLIEGRLPGETDAGEAILIETDSTRHEVIRKEIIDEVVSGVRAAAAPVPLEALADRALRNLGHDKTAGTGWAGAGGFRELLLKALPEDVRLSDDAPYYAYDVQRHVKPVAAIENKPAVRAPESASFVEQPPAPAPVAIQPAPAPAPAPVALQPAAPALQPQAEPAPLAAAASAHRPPQTAEQSYAAAAAAAAPVAPAPMPVAAPAALGGAVAAAATAQAIPAEQPTAEQAVAQPSTTEAASAVQQSIARIHDACQAPPLSPPEYRVLFEVMASEINENGLTGSQTLNSIAARAHGRGIELRRDDVRFVLEVVSEADPWFEQGASANLFSGRFRNFVVARCRGQGLNLSAEELDLIDAWFAGSLPPAQVQPNNAAPQPQPQAQQQPQTQQAGQPLAPSDDAGAEDFPRIIRSRLRG